MSDTRERILEVASDLFIEQGYDATSLREISGKVGVTKAALYYHFANKQDILRALAAPAMAATPTVLSLLPERPVDITQWAGVVAGLSDWLLENRKVLLLFERNHGVMHELANESENFEMHELLHERVDAIFSDEAVPLDDRIRMAASLGVLLSVFGGAFANVAVKTLRPAVDAAVASVLRVGPVPKRSRRPAP
jgi:AcrR family transcriptional regulator